MEWKADKLQRGKLTKGEIRWLIVLAVIFLAYNVIASALPFPKTAVFFVSYGFTLLAILAQVYVVYTAFLRGEGIEGIRSKFYGFPIAKIGFLYLVAQLVLGLVFMALGSVIPVWLPLLLYVLMLAAAVIGFVAADAMREEVERQDKKLVKDVSRMRALQAQARMLASQSQLPEMKAELEKLSEAFRYSDPVSSKATEELEEQLAADLAELQDAVALLKEKEAMELCGKVSVVLVERNQLCKLRKN